MTQALPEREITDLLNTAKAVARAAGAVLAARYHAPRTIELKGKIDLVTDADKAAEAAALEVVRRECPGHAILAEEGGASGESDYRWVIDPLDGTTNYAHGLAHFCASVAVEYRGVLQAGAIYDPLRDELFAGARGHGATLNGAPLKVSEARAPERAMLATGFAYWVQERPDQVLAVFAAYLKKVQALRRFGSAALDLAYVACGRYDGYFEIGLKPWDFAAGVLLVEEAGGRVTTMRGGPLSITDDNILCANPALHAALLPIAAPHL